MHIGEKWVFAILLLLKDDIEIVLDKNGATQFLKGKLATENEVTCDWLSEYQAKIYDFVLFPPELATQKVDSMTNYYYCVIYQFRKAVRTKQVTR